MTWDEAIRLPSCLPCIDLKHQDLQIRKLPCGVRIIYLDTGFLNLPCSTLLYCDTGCCVLRRAPSNPQVRPGGSSSSVSQSSSRAVSRSSSMRNEANREAREAKEARDAAVNLMQQVRI